MHVILHPLDNAVLQYLAEVDLLCELTLDYTNYQGKRALRRVTPLMLFMGETEHHPAFQWLFKAFDHDKQEERDFSVASIHSIQHNRKLIKNAKLP